MQIITEKDKIIIKNPKNFDVVQTLECGQIFRYVINKNQAVVFSQNKKAEINFSKSQIVIETRDVNYFYNFFDLNTDYGKIILKLKDDDLLGKAIDFGSGIRILNNDGFEMLISFIISANNNIPRIKKSIEYLCTNFGTNMGDYYAFPTLPQLKKATVDDFLHAGLGYRASQMFDTVQRLTERDLQNLKTMSDAEKFNFLIGLKGVGEKVANCVLLFGYGVKSVFPVDTWINKVYNKLTNSNETNRKKITKQLSVKYGELSGYAQQYFFYYFRSKF